MPASHGDDRSLGEMFADLSRQIRALIEQELQLARTEMASHLARLKRGLMLLGIGALVASGGLLAAVSAIVLALIEAGVAPWAAALIGAVLTAGLGLLCMRAGVAAIRRHALIPRRTIETLEEDARWLGHQIR
jgi:uncharacterized membrane protein YqjE